MQIEVTDKKLAADLEELARRLGVPLEKAAEQFLAGAVILWAQKKRIDELVDEIKRNQETIDRAEDSRRRRLIAVLEDLLGIDLANRLADLCRSWSLPIQGMLQQMVTDTPTKPMQELMDAELAKLEQNFLDIRAMDERRKRIMIEIAGTLFPSIAPKLEQAQNERIFKLLGDFGTAEDIETERKLAETPALVRRIRERTSAAG